MEIQALGYLGIGTIKIDDWTLLATRRLGMQTVDRGAGLRAFRMDDRRQRLVIDSTMPPAGIRSSQGTSGRDTCRFRKAQIRRSQASRSVCKSLLERNTFLRNATGRTH